MIAFNTLYSSLNRTGGTFSAAYIGSLYKDFIVFALLILAMIFKPTGIFNAKVYDT